METPSVSNTARYSRLVQEYREKERAAQSVNASVADKAEADKQKTDLERQKQQVISELSKRDQEVRTHEQAHASVGGRYASAPSYETTRGPDGREYATGGHVTIDTSPVADDPEATLDKSQVVERAALAPAQPSEQDLKVASEARAMGNEARGQIREQQLEELPGAPEEDRKEEDDDPASAKSEDTGSDQYPSGLYKEPKSFSFGLSFPQRFVGADTGIADGQTRADQLKNRFDILGLSYPPEPTGQSVSITA